MAVVERRAQGVGEVGMAVVLSRRSDEEAMSSPPALHSKGERRDRSRDVYVGLLEYTRRAKSYCCADPARMPALEDITGMHATTKEPCTRNSSGEFPDSSTGEADGRDLGYF